MELYAFFFRIINNILTHFTPALSTDADNERCRGIDDEWFDIAQLNKMHHINVSVPDCFVCKDQDIVVICFSIHNYFAERIMRYSHFIAAGRRGKINLIRRTAQIRKKNEKDNDTGGSFIKRMRIFAHGIPLMIIFCDPYTFYELMLLIFLIS